MKVSSHWMRGGTSKCWVFERAELDGTGVPLDDLLPRLYGSPDPRQIDGVGGGTSTTSKAIIVERSSTDGVDVDFTFAQVGIEDATVDWGSNCGNCSSTVGLFAVEQGWIETQDGYTRVMTRNTNTGQTIVQRLFTPGGELPATPTATMPGTVHPGFEVGLGFVDPAGLTTGDLLPTGNPRDRLVVNGEDYEVSLVDAGAPVVLLSAERLGFDVGSYADWVADIGPWLPALDAIRRAGAVAMGMVGHPGQAERAVPKFGLVSAPASDDADLQVLMLSMGRPHPAMPVTGSVAVTLAAQTPDTVVSDVCPDAGSELRLRIPAGVLTTFMETDSGRQVVGVTRTARTLASATVHLPDDLTSAVGVAAAAATISAR